MAQHDGTIFCIGFHTTGTTTLYDAFSDNPYFRIWRRIYDLFPDAKYILTVRDEDRWIESCVKFYRHRRIHTQIPPGLTGHGARRGARCNAR